MGWTVGLWVTCPASWGWLCLDSRVDVPQAEFSHHSKGEFPTAGADRRGLAQDSSVNVNEQVLVRLVLNGDWDILVIVLVNSEDGLYSGVGEHLDNVSSEAVQKQQVGGGRG